MTRYLHLTIKMSTASIITILIAMAFNLEYTITAGILAVLSIQLTRRDSLMNALQRFLSSIIGLFLAVLMFLVLGYNLWVFALFTVVFIYLSFLLKLSIGIVPTLVLVSHVLLVGQFDMSIIINSIMIMAIAITVALAVNSLYPLKSQTKLLALIDAIDAIIRKDLENLALRISGKINNQESLNTHKELKQELERLKQEAELIDKDILFDHDYRLIHYLNVRSAQMTQIDRMLALIIETTKTTEHALKLAEYVRQLKDDVGHADKATSQRESLKALLSHYRQSALPKTREEFEYRSMLYQITIELDTFLDEKIRFHKRYPNFKVKRL